MEESKGEEVMPKYLIDMPEGWRPKEAHKSCDLCHFDSRGCQDDANFCPLANAVKAVEVEPETEVKRWINHHLEKNKWVAQDEINGKPVKLWATEE